MSGDGNRQLEAAMEQLLIQSYAAENFLQASEQEVNILIPFAGSVLGVYTAQGNGSQLEELYSTLEELSPGGGTDMYQAALQGVEELKQYDLSQYTPAIILLTDGQSGGSFSQLAEAYGELGSQVPIFSLCSAMRTRVSWKIWRNFPTPGCLTAGKTWWALSAV